MKTQTAAARQQVNDYLAALPPDVRRRMKALRGAILSAAPRAVEGFSYGIPGFRLDGRPLIWYAAWRRHTSLYPMTAAIRRAYASALEGYEVSTGTIRFPLDRPLPAGLVRRLVRARAVEVRRQTAERRPARRTNARGRA